MVRKSIVRARWLRQQVPIAGLTVDFAIRSKRLVIEKDGSFHDQDEIQINDAARDERLRVAGWQILRIPAHIAISPDHLLMTVRKELELD